jgi:hypothetical protein
MAQPENHRWHPWLCWATPRNRRPFGVPGCPILKPLLRTNWMASLKEFLIQLLNLRPMGRLAMTPHLLLAPSPATVKSEGVELPVWGHFVHFHCFASVCVCLAELGPSRPQSLPKCPAPTGSRSGPLWASRIICPSCWKKTRCSRSVRFVLSRRLRFTECFVFLVECLRDQLTIMDRATIWASRHMCRALSHSLPKLLRSVNWYSHSAVADVHRILLAWSPSDVRLLWWLCCRRFQPWAHALSFVTAPRWMPL